MGYKTTWRDQKVGDECVLYWIQFFPTNDINIFDASFTIQTEERM